VQNACIVDQDVDRNAIKCFRKPGDAVVVSNIDAIDDTNSKCVQFGIAFATRTYNHLTALMILTAEFKPDTATTTCNDNCSHDEAYLVSARDSMVVSR
jgi:hypothetical protein